MYIDFPMNINKPECQLKTNKTCAFFRRANQDEVKMKYLEKMEQFEQTELKIVQHKDSCLVSETILSVNTCTCSAHLYVSLKETQR